jgi:dihydrofolate reductase
MAKLVYGLNQTLDGYIDHQNFSPDPVLFRHFVDQAHRQTGSIYGRRMYEVMRYWDDDQADWGPEERDFAIAWRSHPKWVVSRTLKEVGPNATLIHGDIEATVRKLKAELPGELEIAGSELAGSLSGSGLIDEYLIYLHPVVVGRGKPFFTGARPPLRLVTSERIGPTAIRLGYVPA